LNGRSRPWKGPSVAPSNLLQNGRSSNFNLLNLFLHQWFWHLLIGTRSAFPAASSLLLAKA
jgi:hypothetical protein